MHFYPLRQNTTHCDATEHNRIEYDTTKCNSKTIN